MSSRTPRRVRREAADRVAAELGGVSPADGPRRADPRLDPEIEAMRRMTVLLAEVPAEAWAPISAPAAAAPALGNGRRRRGIRISPSLAVIAAVACLALGFAGGALIESGGNGPAPAPATRGSSVVLKPLPPGPAGSLAIAYMPGPDQMVLRVAHLPPSPPGTYYELWLMSSLRDLTPVAAFQIGSDGSAQLRLRLPDESRRYTYLDISIQRIGGGTAHSGDSVLRGRVT